MRSCAMLMRLLKGSMLRSRTTSNSRSVLKVLMSARSLRFWSASSRIAVLARSYSSWRARSCASVGVGSSLRSTFPLLVTSYITTLAHPGGGVSPMCVTPLSSTHFQAAWTHGAASAAGRTSRTSVLFMSMILGGLPRARRIAGGTSRCWRHCRASRAAREAWRRCPRVSRWR